MSHGRKFGHQGARGRRSFSTNLRRATEGMPVAVFDDGVSGEITEQVERYTSHLAANPHDQAFDRVLGHLGQAATRALIASGRCSEMVTAAAVDALGAFAERRRAGDIDGPTFRLEASAVLAMAQELPLHIANRALAVATLAARVAEGKNLLGITNGIVAAARVPTVNLTPTHPLDLVETQLLTGDVQTAGARARQLIHQLTGRANQ